MASCRFVAHLRLVPFFCRCKAAAKARMAGGTVCSVHGTGIVEFPFLVLGTSTRYRNFFNDRFSGTSKLGPARLLGSLTCALPFPFILCPVWRTLALMEAVRLG